MKKLSYARILILVLSLALIVGATFVVGVAAAESDPKGKFGSISVAYGEKVAIQLVVNATEEEIKNGDVVVTYQLGDKTANATYYRTDDNDRVWVITEGIAAYNLGAVVSFSSYVNGEQVMSDCNYSVAQFIYKMLYTNSGVSAEYKNLYESLLAYGEASQIALGINTNQLVTDSTYVHTSNADVKVNGTAKSVFVTGESVSLTPSYLGVIPVGKELEGWTIVDNGVEKAVGLSFTASGVVEVVGPVFADMDPTPFTLQNGGFEDGLGGWTVVGNIGGVSAGKQRYACRVRGGNLLRFGKVADLIANDQPRPHTAHGDLDAKRAGVATEDVKRKLLAVQPEAKLLTRVNRNRADAVGGGGSPCRQGAQKGGLSFTIAAYKGNFLAAFNGERCVLEHEFVVERLAYSISLNRIASAAR